MLSSRKKPAITLLIVALLAIGVIAVPAWRSHQIRSHITDALKMTDAAKLVVMESATVHGGLAHLEADDLKFNAEATASAYVVQITIGPDGRIQLTTKGTGASPDPVLLLTPSQRASSKGVAPIQWSCQMVIGNQDVAPENCRMPVPETTTSSSPAEAASSAGASSSRSV